MGLKEEMLEMKKEVEEIQEESFAMELLKDARKTNKRQFIIILVILGMFTCLLGYTIWLLNDIGTEKSFDKMLQSLEDFTYLIMQEADSQDKIEKVRKTARKISEF